MLICSFFPLTRMFSKAFSVRVVETHMCPNPLPKNKIFHWFKLKAFADDKTNDTEKIVLGIVENISRKGEHSGYQHFFLFP